MSKRTDSTDRKNVVVVGGGFAGLAAAKELAKKLDASRYNLTFITSRPYFVHVVAMLRIFVSDADNLENLAFIPYDKLKGISHTVGTVTAIEETAPGQGGYVVLKDGDRIPYAALILATGTIWSGPLDFGDTDEEIRHAIKVWRERYASAKHVVVVGGGAVGIETVGDIKDVYPGTKVTLVHSDDLLLNNAYPDKFRKMMEQRVRQRGIEIVSGDYIDTIPEPGTTTDITTRRGKTIRGVDLVVQSFGGRPNSAFINTLDPGVLTKKGNVRVQPTLEVVGHPGVFAIGDIIEWKEQKQAGKAPYHASTAVANIISFLNGAPQSKKYSSMPEMIMIPVGKNYGAGYFGFLWGITVGNWLTKMIKGKGLLIGMARGNLGY